MRGIVGRILLAQTRTNQKYAKNVGCRNVTETQQNTACIMSTGINAELGGSLEFSAIDFASNPGSVFDAFGDRWSGTTKYVIHVAYNTFSTNR